MSQLPCKNYKGMIYTAHDGETEFEFDADNHLFTLKGGQQIPSVTGILKAEGFSRHYFATDEHRERGHRVALTVELFEKGTLNYGSIIGTDLEGYLAGWIQCKADKGLITQHAEQPSVSGAYLFGGIPDWIGTVDRRGLIIDIKTGVLEDWFALQLAGYELLAPKRSNGYLRWVVKLTREGTYQIVKFTTLTDRVVFLSALTTYRWKEEHNAIRNND